MAKVMLLGDESLLSIPNAYPNVSITIAYDCETRPIWSPWGWAVDRSRLTWLIVNWCFRNRKCFTCQFRSQYRRTRREVFPILSRIQNIGYEMGENGRTPEWYRANHRTPWVASEEPAESFSMTCTRYSFKHVAD